MNVTTFRLHSPHLELLENPIYGKQKATYKIPTLPAYAITDSQLSLDKLPHLDFSSRNYEYELLDDGVIIIDEHLNLFGPPSGVLTVYHRGIKEFQLLFPHIESESLRLRLGTFAEEAEKAFDSQSWVSYCLMVGDVVEGLLYNKFGKLGFKDLIKSALDNKIISAEEASLIDEIRLARNKIHANRHEESIANRKTAFELSTAYDRLIKRNWFF